MTAKVAMNAKVIMRRTERGLTQVALAKRLRLNHADIVRIEQGWIPPEPIRRRVASALKATDDTLFGEAVRALA